LISVASSLDDVALVDSSVLCEPCANPASIADNARSKTQRCASQVARRRGDVRVAEEVAYIVLRGGRPGVVRLCAVGR
jgi:hypothetical protein